MSRHQQQRELDELLARLIDGAMDEESSLRLTKLLQEDPEARRQYHDHVMLHMVLYWKADRSLRAPVQDGVAPASEGTLTKAECTVEAPGSRFWLNLAARHSMQSSLVIAVLVIGLLLTAMAFIMPPFYRHHSKEEVAAPGKFAAQLTGTHKAVWAERQLGAFPNAHLQAGHRYQLESGLAELTYHNGARVILEGPCVYDVAGRGTGALQQGKLTARVNERARGFTIATPTGAIVGWGAEFAASVDAEFSASVDAEGNTFAEVIDGVAKLNRIRDGAVVASMRLQAGNAAEMHVGGESVMKAEPRRDFALSLPKSPARRPMAHFAFEHNGFGGANGRARKRVSYDQGVVGRCVVIDASSRGVTVARAFDPSAGDFSIAFFVKRANLDRGSDDGIIDALARSEVGYEMGLDSNDLLFLLLDTATDSQLFTSTGAITDTAKFHHVAVTVDRSKREVKFYIDGALDSTVAITSVTGSVSPSHALWLGGLDNDLEKGLDGMLDEVRFYDCVLSGEEISALSRGPL